VSFLASCFNGIVTSFESKKVTDWYLRYVLKGGSSSFTLSGDRNSRGPRLPLLSLPFMVFSVEAVLFSLLVCLGQSGDKNPGSYLVAFSGSECSIFLKMSSSLSSD
jgi:hypothetical protein